MAETVAFFGPPVAAVLSVVGGVMGYRQSQYQMAVADQNADAARREGSQQAAILSAEARRDVGHARALAGASGLTADGSAADVMGAMAAAGDFNARSAIYQGRRRVQQAQVDRRTAKQQGYASLINGFAQAGTILTAGLSGSGGPAPATAPAAAPSGWTGPR